MEGGGRNVEEKWKKKNEKHDLQLIFCYFIVVHCCSLWSTLLVICGAMIFFVIYDL